MREIGVNDMRILLMLGVIYTVNCSAMEIKSSVTVHNDELVFQLFDAIKNNQLRTLKEITTKHPAIIHSSLAMPVFCNDSVFPTHVAAAYGRHSCLEHLLSVGAPADSPTQKMKNTPLHFARTPEIVRLLLRYNAPASPENKQAITPMCNILFAQEGTTLRKKCAEERYDIAHELGRGNLKSLFAPNSQQRTPLHVAVLEKSLFAVDFLLRRKADPTVLDKHKKSPFDYVIEEKHNPLMFQLFAYYGLFYFPQLSLAQLFDRTDSDLFLDRWAGVVSFLQERKTANETHFIDRICPMIRCSNAGCIINGIFSKDLGYIFTSNQLIEIEDGLKEQYFIARKWIEKNKYRGLKKQLETMSFITIYNDWIFKLLIYAIEIKKSKCIKILLQSNRQSLEQLFLSWGNHPDDRGGTLLHFAVLSGSPRAIKLLMRYGMDPLTVNNEGKTPACYSYDLEKYDCLRVIQERMIKQYLRAIKNYNYTRARQLIEELMKTDLNHVQKKAFLLISLMARLKSTTKILQKPVKTILQESFDQHRIFPHQLDAITRVPLFWVVVHQNNFGLTSLFLKYGAVIDPVLFEEKNKKISSKLKIFLKLKYEEQCVKIKYQGLRCCICLDSDSPEKFLTVPCGNDHPDTVVCFQCSEHINQCPLCRAVLL